MTKASRVALLAVAALLAGAPLVRGAKEKDKDAAKEKDKKAAPGGKNLPPGVTLNACGCYKKGSGCVCTDRKAKCDCPGDCEPVGCEEKRQKELDREYAAEVKRAQEEDKKRKAAEEAAENEGAAEGPDKPAEKSADKTGEKTADKPAEKTGDKAGGADKPAHSKEPREKK
jgi:hypothetical protein